MKPLKLLQPIMPNRASAFASNRRMSVGQTFVSLRHRNYRLWFIGQLVSLFGTWMQATAPVFLIIFALTRWLPLSLLVLIVAGMTLILIINLPNVLVQTLVPDGLRGRVMSVYSLLFYGMMPLGALWIGALAERVSEPVAIIFGALIELGYAALIWTMVPTIRRLK